MDKIIDLPQHFHKVVDCQWSCPTHTPVPEYIRLIKEQRYTEAYMVNRRSNVFPGVLGRVCDAPCEDACRRGRVDQKAVGICRLKRVTSDFVGDFSEHLPRIPTEKNGKRVALIGAGPAALTVANDLLPLGYACTIFDREDKAGGAMYTQVPRFRLPQAVLDRETSTIIGFGAVTHLKREVTSLRAILDEGYDAVVVATGALTGRDLDLPGRKQAGAAVRLATDFLREVTYAQCSELKGNVIVIGGGNTAMDCARTALRVGAANVKAIAPESYAEMKAFALEKDDAHEEGAHLVNHLLPEAFIVENGELKAMRFAKLSQCYDADGRWNPKRTGETEEHPCDHVLLAIGQNVVLPFIESDLGIVIKAQGGGSDLRAEIDPKTFQSANPRVFFAGDAATGPRNIIWAVATGHEVALSIHLFCTGRSVHDRPADGMVLTSQKMGLNQWSYDNAYHDQGRAAVPKCEIKKSLANLKLESELGYDERLALAEAERCLDCDVQTVFFKDLCIECDACVDICPTNCLTITPSGPEADLKTRLSAPVLNAKQDLFMEPVPQTNRLMVKDENLCLHCGLCAERCPTAAWDMQQSRIMLGLNVGLIHAK